MVTLTRQPQKSDVNPTLIDGPWDCLNGSWLRNVRARSLRLGLLASGQALWPRHHVVLIEKDLMRMPVLGVLVQGL